MVELHVLLLNCDCRGYYVMVCFLMCLVNCLLLKLCERYDGDVYEETQLMTFSFVCADSSNACSV